MSIVLRIDKAQTTATETRTQLSETETPGCRLTPIHQEQIQSLVEQLFFGSSVRHVGFAAVDGSTEVSPLCCDVAEVLSEQGTHDIGLIDANLSSPPLENQLGLDASAASDSPWPIRARLWFVPRKVWMPEAGTRVVTEQDLCRLQELTARFDYSILCCPPLSWAATRIGRACEGLVLVLTANKTRRLVAGKMRDHLRSAQVPLLGSVLTERRFPLPSGLYRSL